MSTMKNDFTLYVLVLWLILETAHGCMFKQFTTCGCKKVNIKSLGLTGKTLECSAIDVEKFFTSVKLPEESINVISMDFSGNREERLSRSTFGTDEHILELLKGVVKLDFSRNSIWDIAANTFSPFPNLTRLNLSSNSIGNLSQNMFSGLLKLQVLDLSFNKFPVIPGDAFSLLTSLKRLNLQSINLVCNCLMKNFTVWAKNNTGVKVIGTCHLPQSGIKLRALNPQQMECDASNPLSKLPHFEMTPAEPQLVFEGDDLIIQCEGTDLPNSEVIWSFNGTLLGKMSSSLSFVTESNSYKSIILGSVTIKNLTAEHSGLWNCTVASQHGSETRVLLLAVLKQNAPYCMNEVIHNNRGYFVWPSTVDGMSKNVQCQPSKHSNPHGASHSATRYCKNGTWSIGQYEACPFLDEVTEKVYQTLNADLSEHNVAGLLSNLVGKIDDKPVTDPMVLSFISNLMVKTLPLLTPDNKAKLPLLDLASYSMKANHTLLKQAQIKSNVCDEITKAIRSYTLERASTAVVHADSANIAIGGMAFQYKSQYEEMSCVVAAKQGNLQSACESVRVIHEPEPFVFLQKNVLSNCKGKNDGFKIYFIIYRNGSLFQSSTAQSYKSKNLSSHDIFSYDMVYEVGVRGCEASNLTSPIVFNFETKRPGSYYAAVWTSMGWIRDPACKAYCINKTFTQVACYKFATVTVIYDPALGTCGQDYISLEDFTHPAVFAATVIMSVCLICVLFSHIFCAGRLKISKESRHTILNICMHMIIAAGMFTFCIKRIDSRNLCIVCGIVLHYTSLAVLFWIALSVRSIYHELLALARPPSLEPKPPKPMLRFYLIGCGIPIMICGITAAAKVQNYGGEERLAEGYCWLIWETSIYAFYLPAALIALICVLFLLIVLCTFNGQSHQLDSPRSPLARPIWQSNQRVNNGNDRYQAIATEEYCHCPGHVNNGRTESPIHTNSALHPTKSSEQSCKSQLVGVAVLFTFYIFTWVFAALSIAAPNMQYHGTLDSSDFREDYRYFYERQSVEYQNKNTLSDTFSWFYAIFAVAAGVFVILKFLMCRTDCRARCKQICGSCGRSQAGYMPESDSKSNASCAKTDDCEDTDLNMEYFTSSNDKSSLPGGRKGKGAYTTVKTDPTMETMLNSTENAENSGRAESLQYMNSIPKSHFVNRDAEFPIHMDPCVIHKSDLSHQGSCRMVPLAQNQSHSFAVDSSGHRHLSHPYPHDPALSFGIEAMRYHPVQDHFQHLAYHNHHLMHHQHDHGKPIKMTNLHIAHDSSMTEHSLDEVGYNNMHTVPVIMQRNSQAKINNTALIERYQKVRRALERKRARQRKLNVLREYAQDPLTSNDESKVPDQGKNKSGSVNESSPLIQSHGKEILDGGALQSSGSIKCRPLLLSPSSLKKHDNNHKNKSNSPNKRVKRLEGAGQPRPIHKDKKNRQTISQSQNSTPSERELDTTSSEKSLKKQSVLPQSSQAVSLSSPKGQLSAISPSSDSKVGQDNHGYLTLQQFQSANAFLLPNNGSVPSESHYPTENAENSPYLRKQVGQSSNVEKPETSL